MRKFFNLSKRRRLKQLDPSERFLLSGYLGLAITNILIQCIYTVCFGRMNVSLNVLNMIVFFCMYQLYLLLSEEERKD